MYLITISFIVGLYIKAISLALKNFSAKDVGTLLAATVVHVYVFARAFEEFSFNMSLLLGSIGFVVVVASAFKKRIVPMITEGTLLLYGLIALWLFLVNLNTESVVSIVMTALVALYCCAVLALCISKVRVAAKIQTTLVVVFLIFNIGISFLFFSFKDFMSYFEIGTFDYLIQLKMMMFGYVLFQLISNIFYLAYFIPVAGKNQSMGSRMLNIKKHAEELRSRYVDIDVSYVKTITIFFLIALLFINTFFPFVKETTTLVAAVLIIGTIITTWYGEESSHSDSDTQVEIRGEFHKKFMLFVVMILLVIMPYGLHALSVRFGFNTSQSLTSDSVIESFSHKTDTPVQSMESTQASSFIDEGLREYNAREYIKAEFSFRSALFFEPNNKYAHNNLGLALFFQERFEEAEAEYLQSIALDPSYANAHNNLGKLYEFTGRYDSALIHLDQAITLNPRAQSFVTRGDVYAQMGKDKQALDDYMTAQNMGLDSFSLKEKIRVSEYKTRQ